MRLKYVILPFAVMILILLQSCGGNADAEYAFKAASAGMNENTVSSSANDAYMVLYDLNTEDACKLTLAYYYLYNKNYATEYGDRFGACYKYAIDKDEESANEYFRSLTGVSDIDSKLRINYENLGLMKQASEAFDSAKEEALRNSDDINSLPSNEIQTGAMAFIEAVRKQRHYYMPDTYSRLSDSQKKMLSPLGLVVNNSNLNLVIGNNDSNQSTWNYAQENASSYNSEDIKNWRLMSLSEGKSLSRIYDDLLMWANRWNSAGISCDMAISSAYTSTTNGDNCYTIDIRDGMESLCPKDEDWMGSGRYVSSI